VEPNPSNFRSLEENLRPYGDRVDLLHAAVWSHPAELVMETVDEGKEHAGRVRACAEGELPTLAGFDIATLLKRSGRQRISILKLDVEGAEQTIFSGDVSWVDSVDVVTIELHGELPESSPVMHAFEGSFEVVRSGKHIRCRRLREASR
ncbi:MAG: hypothetical protein QOK22_111, partial [Gaiellaceae bacterium]|nr:hypothetical protein [Gaiellaceae bacterium]